ncbi:MAG: hypothetical protein M1816_005571 [Peltula sp. TS41687]|nr:MAG: hypothetical protein M1816_005571 [Peltula sp. TS41687]
MHTSDAFKDRLIEHLKRVAPQEEIYPKQLAHECEEEELQFIENGAQQDVISYKMPGIWGEAEAVIGVKSEDDGNTNSMSLSQTVSNIPKGASEHLRNANSSLDRFASTLTTHSTGGNAPLKNVKPGIFSVGGTAGFVGTL